MYTVTVVKLGDYFPLKSWFVIVVRRSDLRQLTFKFWTEKGAKKFAGDRGKLDDKFATDSASRARYERTTIYHA